jgi:hypothetical protein
MHTIDKIDVRDARWPVHDAVASRGAEARMRRPVVLAAVRLDLRDPPDPDPRVSVVADQQRPEERTGSDERRGGEQDTREGREPKAGRRRPVGLADAAQVPLR